MEIRLIYSPDDNGFYFERFNDWKTSQVFPTKMEAWKALRDDLIIWED